MKPLRFQAAGLLARTFHGLNHCCDHPPIIDRGVAGSLACAGSKPNRPSKIDRSELSEETMRFAVGFLILRTSSTIQVLGGLAVSPDARNARVGRNAHRTDCGCAAE
jgi:hypothetical protein